MGKNYYAIPREEIKSWKKRKEKSLSQAFDMKGLIPIIEEYYKDREPQNIHIGKSSAGWDFLWQLNSKEYYSNKTELLEWLKTVDIVDEYNSPYTYEEFINQAFDRKDYYGNPTKKHKSAGYSNDYIVIDDLEFLDTEFC